MAMRAPQVLELVAKILVPLAVVAAAGIINQGISERAAAVHFVTMAATILGNKDQPKPARDWALRVLDEFSPVPFTEPMRREIVSGEVEFGESFWRVVTGRGIVVRATEPVVVQGTISPEDLARLEAYFAALAASKAAAKAQKSPVEPPPEK